MGADSDKASGAICWLMLAGAAPWWAGTERRLPHLQMTPCPDDCGGAGARGSERSTMKPALRLKKGGWIYLHLEANRRGDTSTGTLLDGDRRRVAGSERGDDALDERDWRFSGRRRRKCCG